MNKRYAIVRVDNKCLSDYENIKCPYDYKCAKCKFGKLKNYNYGDTKEQLIRKVAQALELCMKKGYRTITSEEYAKEIVEFLGVME